MSEVKEVMVDEATVCVSKNAYNALDVFNAPRVEGEADLVTLMYRDLITFYDKVAAEMFMANPEIQLVKDLNSISQRVIINRWLNNAFLIYRNRVDDPNVSTILPYIIIDGTVDNWVELLQTVVLPYFKLNNVLNILIGE